MKRILENNSTFYYEQFNWQLMGIHRVRKSQRVHHDLRAIISKLLFYIHIRTHVTPTRKNPIQHENDWKIDQMFQKSHSCVNGKLYTVWILRPRVFQSKTQWPTNLYFYTRESSHTFFYVLCKVCNCHFE